MAALSSKGGPVQGLAAGAYVCLGVTDTGIGMDAETLRRCIEPFYTSKGIGKGTGLGLSMVHGLCAQSGGRLVMRSAPGEGTTAEMWLPAAAKTSAKAEHDEHDVVLASRGGTILLVDDDDLARESTAAMIAEFGYDAVQAGSGAEALEILRNGTRVNALVTDFLMPGMTGAQLGRQVRALNPQIPVLIITGYSRTEEIGDDFRRLTKPFRQIDLAEAIDAALVARKGATA